MSQVKVLIPLHLFFHPITYTSSSGKRSDSISLHSSSPAALTSSILPSLPFPCSKCPYMITSLQDTPPTPVSHSQSYLEHLYPVRRVAVRVVEGSPRTRSHTFKPFDPQEYTFHKPVEEVLGICVGSLMTLVAVWQGFCVMDVDSKVEVWQSLYMANVERNSKSGLPGQFILRGCWHFGEPGGSEAKLL